jgi:hypothetical protein
MSTDLSYSYKASVLGSPLEFTLNDNALEWSIGRRGGLARYDRIARVRLSFRPITMQSYRFQTEIWAEGCPKIRIASTSWRSMLEQARQDEAYTAFIVELHRRIAAAGAPTRFTTGISFIIFWFGVAVTGVTAVGLAALTVKALRLGEWAGAALIGGFLALFMWQLGIFFQRNRPGTYRPDHVPDHLLPVRQK